MASFGQKFVVAAGRKEKTRKVCQGCLNHFSFSRTEHFKVNLRWAPLFVLDLETTSIYLKDKSDLCSLFLMFMSQRSLFE